MSFNTCASELRRNRSLVPPPTTQRATPFGLKRTFGTIYSNANLIKLKSSKWIRRGGPTEQTRAVRTLRFTTGPYTKGGPATLEEVDTAPPFVSWTLSAIYTVTKIGYQVTV